MSGGTNLHGLSFKNHRREAEAWEKKGKKRVALGIPRSKKSGAKRKQFSKRDAESRRKKGNKNAKKEHREKKTIPTTEAKQLGGVCANNKRKKPRVRK